MSQKKSLKDKKRAKRKEKRLNDKQNKFFARLEKVFSDTKNEPIQFLGYNRECPLDKFPYEYSSDGLVCMVSEVDEDNQKSLNSDHGINIHVGQWIVSEANENHDSIIHGPFETKEQAFDHGRKELGAIRYISNSIFD